MALRAGLLVYAHRLVAIFRPFRKKVLRSSLRSANKNKLKISLSAVQRLRGFIVSMPFNTGLLVPNLEPGRR